MAKLEPVQIKSIVKGNFDRSVELYQEFEKRYGLFRFLTLELAEEACVNEGMSVLDIGCGTGTSTFILGKLVGESGKVIGLDISEQMLDKAKMELKTKGKTKTDFYQNLEFQNIDADELEQFSNHNLDAILYNACIFLIPEPENTLKSAYDLLNTSGNVGMNYLVGLYSWPEFDVTQEKIDLFRLTKDSGKPFAPYGRQINDVTKLTKILRDIGYKNIRSAGLSKKMSISEVRAFYSIPAQSAALWPKTKYEERLVLLEKLIDYLKEEGIESFYQHWGWITAVK
jgi:ubiquinone/menaquinone biosynthesis C-methylase UbiE